MSELSEIRVSQPSKRYVIDQGKRLLFGVDYPGDHRVRRCAPLQITRHGEESKIVVRGHLKETVTLGGIEWSTVFNAPCNEYIKLFALFVSMETCHISSREYGDAQHHVGEASSLVSEGC